MSNFSNNIVWEYISSQKQVSEWHKTLSKGREIVENLPNATSILFC